MTARNENDDLVQENISVQYFGVPLEICFNIKYLLEFLSSIDGDEVSIKMENAKSGVLMQDVALKSSYVLMPMQL
jgi:DNA polymerase-3 subunit beta